MDGGASYKPTTGTLPCRMPVLTDWDWPQLLLQK